LVESIHWKHAIATWRAALGPEHVIEDPARLHSAETTTYATHQVIPVILRPSCTGQVQECLRIAARFGVGIYPISTGKNWGYGSAVPVHDVSALLDLGRMNRILDFSEDLAYVTVEPGVTQAQLHDFLRERRSNLWMDASGAAPGSSLIGNTMERGFGHTPYGDHFAHSCGLEVILPTGERIETGFCRFPDAKTGPLYRWGVGPVLDGLFSQSNLGVVTRMTIWLMPAPEYFQGFFFSCNLESMLGPVVDALRPLRINGTIQSGMHIGNDYKVLNGLQQFPWAETDGKTPLSPGLMQGFRSHLRIGAWNGSGALYGTRTQVREARRLIKAALHGKVDRLQFLDDRKLRLAKRFAKPYQFLTGWNLTRTLTVLEAVYNLMKGIPTGKTLGSVYWRKRTPVPEEMNPDRDGCGLLWFAPIVPARGTDVEALTSVVIDTMLEDGFEPMISLTLLTERAIACVVSISFDRAIPGEDDRAMSCYRRLLTEVTALGYRSYRLGVHSMEQMNVQDEYGRLLDKIKSAIDPAAILSAGRYEASHDGGAARGSELFAGTSPRLESVM
jgi:4-cresol dehydrogenase (hydroxylating)